MSYIDEHARWLNARVERGGLHTIAATTLRNVLQIIKTVDWNVPSQSSARDMLRQGLMDEKEATVKVQRAKEQLRTEDGDFRNMRYSQVVIEESQLRSAKSYIGYASCVIQNKLPPQVD